MCSLATKFLAYCNSSLIEDVFVPACCHCQTSREHSSLIGRTDGIWAVLQTDSTEVYPGYRSNVAHAWPAEVTGDKHGLFGEVETRDEGIGLVKGIIPTASSSGVCWKRKSAKAQIISFYSVHTRWKDIWAREVRVIRCGRVCSRRVQLQVRQVDQHGS